MSPTRRQVPGGESEVSESRPKRVRCVQEPPTNEQQRGGAGSSSRDRPTAAEAAAADKIITALRQVNVVPPLLAPQAGAETAVVACALALHFGEAFDSDRDAKQSFGLHPSSDVRGRWVNGKLCELLKYDPEALREAAATFSGVPAAAPATVSVQENTSPQKQPPPTSSTLPPVSIPADMQRMLGHEACAFIENEGLLCGRVLIPAHLPMLFTHLVEKLNDARRLQQNDARRVAEAHTDGEATLEKARALLAEAREAHAADKRERLIAEARDREASDECLAQMERARVDMHTAADRMRAELQAAREAGWEEWWEARGQFTASP